MVMQMKQGTGQQKLAVLSCEQQEASYQERLQELTATYEHKLQEQEASYQERLQELTATYEHKLQEQEASYQERLQTIEQHLHQAHARIAELERRLSKDSH